MNNKDFHRIPHRSTDQVSRVMELDLLLAALIITINISCL